MRIHLTLAAGAYLFAASCGKELSMAETYPGPWREKFNLSIAEALVVNNIKGCGQFMYRAHHRQRGEYLVYCTGDSKFWTAYLVWVPSERVMGPYPTDPTIPAT
jgi:hypothetical protein